MGKFQLNKEGEDPIKIYEDTFKVANDTIETHLDKLGKQPNPISESKASEVFSPSDEEVLEYIRNNPSQNGTGIVTGMGWDGVEETDVGIMRLIDAGKIETQNGGYVVNESKASEDWEDEESERVQKALDKMNADAYMKQLTKKGYNEESLASEDHPVEDITDVHVHGKNNSVDKVSGVDITVEEADNYKQKDFGNQNEWEDDLDELRGLGGKLPDNNALWNSVEAIASEGKDAYGNYDSHSMPPASGYTGRNWDSRSDIEQQADVDQKIKNVLDVESLASEDYGNMNTVQNPNLVTDGYPMDEEGFARANWDDASIEDRKNWLIVQRQMESEFAEDEAYTPYFSLDSYTRSQLVKDLHMGGIHAMGTGYL